MNNPMITSPSPTTTEQKTRKPAHNGLYLVSRNNRPLASSAQTTSARTLTLAPAAKSAASPAAEILEARSAESLRMKLAACFGAILTAPVVWCLHTLLLSH